MPNPNKNQLIAVVKRGTECRVVPPSVVLDHNDTISWLNLTGDDVTVMFPHAGVFGVHAGAAFAQSVGHGNKHDPGAVQNLTQACPYCVFCQVTGTFALGNSDPEIIVG